MMKESTPSYNSHFILYLCSTEFNLFNLYIYIHTQFSLAHNDFFSCVKQTMKTGRTNAGRKKSKV